MCPRCVKDPNLSRGRWCSDSGVYLANLKACNSCGKTDLTVTRTENADSEDDEEDLKSRQDHEVVVYRHVCSSCDHVVATHKSHFWVEAGYQEYRMDCGLCGIGEDSISIAPKDPRKQMLL